MQVDTGRPPPFLMALPHFLHGFLVYLCHGTSSAVLGLVGLSPFADHHANHQMCTKNYQFLKILCGAHWQPHMEELLIFAFPSLVSWAPHHLVSIPSTLNRQKHGVFWWFWIFLLVYTCAKTITIFWAVGCISNTSSAIQPPQHTIFSSIFMQFWCKVASGSLHLAT